jgi:deoxyadenosine/deoxycytidine kinase
MGGQMFVGISVLIGAGKSTLTRQLAEELDLRAWIALTRQLAEELDLRAWIAERKHQKVVPSVLITNPPAPDYQSHKWKAVFEPVDENPYLEDFYLDMKRWGFSMQMFLLAARFQQHQEVLWDPVHKQGGGVVQDRTIYEDTIFARMLHNDGLIGDREWQTYQDHFQVMQGFLRYPDVILYLKVSPETALRRINERSREEEQGKLPLSYLQALYDGYEEFVEEMARYTTVVTVDWEEYKPASEVADLLEGGAESIASKFLRSLRRI